MELLQAAHLRAVHRMLHMQFNSFVLLLALCKYADYDNQLATVLRNVLALAMPGGTGPISGNEIFLKRKAGGKQDLFLFHWQVLPVCGRCRCGRCNGRWHGGDCQLIVRFAPCEHIVPVNHWD